MTEGVQKNLRCRYDDLVGGQDSRPQVGISPLIRLRGTRNKAHGNRYRRGDNILLLFDESDSRRKKPANLQTDVLVGIHDACMWSHLLGLLLNFVLHPEHSDVGLSRTCVKGDNDVLP